MNEHIDEHYKTKQYSCKELAENDREKIDRIRIIKNFGSPFPVLGKHTHGDDGYYDDKQRPERDDLFAYVYNAGGKQRIEYESGNNRFSIKGRYFNAKA